MNPNCELCYYLKRMKTVPDKILENLNDKQIEAVRAIKGPVLILAGAGSGKTRALTHRIAYLIASGIKPENILAVTFTNKAAGEIKERVRKLLQVDNRPSQTSPWIGTFHSLCLKILRKEADRIGYNRNFVIYDEDDQLSLMKNLLQNLGFNINKFNPLIMLEKISKLKSELISWDEYSQSAQGYMEKILAQVYEAYQTILEKSNAMDFDDLIMLCVKLFKKDPKTLEKYQNIFRYILVDEYQDTNHAQYAWVNLLAQKHRNLFIIGDDYQCLPPETKIKTENGYKKIESIKAGDKVISPAGRGEIFTDEVTAVKKFKFRGFLYNIKTAGGLSLNLTPNHVLFGKLLPSKSFYITYLMYSKKLGYRIGVTTGLRNVKGGKANLGLNVRANQERADKMWILKVVPNLAEAHFWEAYFAFKYGLPTTVFFSDRGKGSKPVILTQDYINEIYRLIPTEERARQLMSDLNLFREFPHHRPQGTVKYKTERITVNLTYFSSKPGLRMKSKLRGARVAINNKDKRIKKLLKEAGYSIRKGKKATWRFETSFRNYSDAEKTAQRIASLCGNLEISKKALVTNLNFDFLPASHIHPHMIIPIFKNGRIINETIAEVKKVLYSGFVYDLDIKKSHTYIANSFIVHNSIYGWRQADIRNILDFEKDYPEAKVIMLEQNYRSTKNIIAAANNIILNNRNQKHKKLWTENPEGEKIILKETADEQRESAYIIKTIQENLKHGYNLQDFTILYRTHAQSRAIEEAMVKHGIPYRIIGGVKFYQRREIKDILAYLRLIANPNDILSFERIYNVPNRGIGLATFDKVRRSPGYKGLVSLTKIRENLADIGQKQATAIDNLVNTIQELTEKSKEMSLSNLLRYLFKKIDYETYIKGVKGQSTSWSIDGEERWENVRELLTVARRFDELKPPTGLEKFLEEATLIQEIDELKEREKAVKLMTIHSAKGLEFPVVFIVGMEDGIFPHARSIFNPQELEEERRLCYVGITRAKKQVYLTFCRKRSLYGQVQFNPPSRFLFEIPEHLINFSPLQEGETLDEFIEYY